MRRLKTIDIANALGVHRNTVLNWRKTGRLNGYDLKSVVEFVREDERRRYSDLLDKERCLIRDMLIKEIERRIEERRRENEETVP